MRKVTFIVEVLGVLLIASAALADPFLTCDPYTKQGDGTDPTHFLLKFDDGDWITVPAVERDNELWLEYDLSGLADGKHVVRAKVVNMWGESDESDPFEFPKRRLPAPENIRFSTR